MYDLKFYKNKKRTSLYSQESFNYFVRPFSKIQSTACDFNFSDDLAIVSEPIGIPDADIETLNWSEDFYDYKFADLYTKHLGLAEGMST